MARVGLVDSPRFEDHLTAECPERPARVPAIRRTLDEQGLLDRLTSVSPGPVDGELLRRIHSDAYVQEVLRFCAEGGGLLDDGDTIVSTASAEVAMLAAGGGVAAVEQVMSGTLDRAFALVRPPGHHAMPDRAMGFCLFNNVALMAERARQLGARRVMILDWDVHHANGTQAAFADRDDVFVLSWHQSGLWPYSGAVSEEGTGAGTGTTLNLPMTRGSGDAAYWQTWQELVVPAAERFQPDLLLLSAGFDAHWRDPLADIQLSVPGYARMAQALVTLAESLTQGRLVAVLEGGYDLQGLRHAAAATIRQLLDADGTAIDPLGLSPRGTVKEADNLIRTVRTQHAWFRD
ncbi:MAG: histone deacetylase [Candidatus Sericytochromatia bacterium]|nr:histone deacetylase [Candidatus Sericytochromatia bacterium]